MHTASQLAERQLLSFYFSSQEIEIKLFGNISIDRERDGPGVETKETAHIILPKVGTAVDSSLLALTTISCLGDYYSYFICNSML